MSIPWRQRAGFMVNDKEDIQLINRILAGEQNLYAQFVDRYKTYAFTIAFRILNNRHEAEEAAQDGFIKAYHHLRNFNRQAKFSTWLYRIVFNTAISYKRKQRVSFYSIEHTIIEHYQDAEKILERQDKTRYLNEAMNRLNEADKLAISLFYLKEFSLEEIGEITGMQPNTAKVRIHRARLRLADELKRILQKEALTL